MIGDNAPLISCIVPAYNSERYLGKALDSIFDQSYRPIEVIVVDDGSTDATLSVARCYPRSVRCIVQEECGPAATRSRGVWEARGPFVAFLDADDLWHPEKLSRQMERFRTRPDLEICVTHVRLLWAEELREEAERQAPQSRCGVVPGYATTTLLARRSVFDKVGMFDPSLWFTDATEWFLRAFEGNVVAEILPEVLTYHRMHQSNLTRRRSRESRAEFLRIVKSSLDRRRLRGRI